MHATFPNRPFSCPRFPRLLRVPAAMAFLLTVFVAAPNLSVISAATPLNDVHPGFTLHDLRPQGFQPDVGGMAFLSDGRLVVGSWGGTRDACCPPNSNVGGREYTGKVYVLSGVSGANPNVSVDTIASGLEDLMGLTVVNDVIYVSGGNRILRLNRNGNNGPVTSVDTVFILPGTPQASGPNAGDSLYPVKGRSEWLYGLLARNDTLFVNPSSMFRSNLNQLNPYRGRHLAVTPGNGTTDKRGSFVTRATGFRHPTGLTFGPEGSIWTNETQGNWVPTNKLIALKDGAHYGYRHTGAGADPAWNNLTETPAAVFLPQEGSGGRGNKDATGIVSNSPGAPLYLTQGPYAGQFIMGDVSWGGIQRFFVEKVNGEWQGAAFVWMGGLESGAYRMLQGTDGDIYVGMMGTTGDWSWNGQFYGLQKLRPTGTPAFEMLAVRSRAQGMEIEFTLPVDTVAAKNPANWQVQTYYYTPTQSYGGLKAGTTTLNVADIRVSSDGRTVYLPVSGLVARTDNQHRIVEITTGGNIRSATNQAIHHNKAYYTLNAISPTQPFTGTSVDRSMASRRLADALRWSVASDGLRVESPFRGDYTLRLTDLRGRTHASTQGTGAGSRVLSLAGLRGQVAVLEARGDGVTLRRTVLVP